MQVQGESADTNVQVEDESRDTNVQVEDESRGTHVQMQDEHRETHMQVQGDAAGDVVRHVSLLPVHSVCSTGHACSTGKEDEAVAMQAGYAPWGS
eukprot:1145417-Pelagomonas_calceolata.AAC.1